ncbi:MAG: zinc dependent phospholipase C family protein [Clostridia bacterium]|nr:zinc dependent phospholipase C family protein [Clostridia bacterium]
MPNLFTHYLCGQKALLQSGNPAIRETILQNRQIFNLGTQGPDILFYYRVWPWLSSKEIDEAGETIHNEKVSDFFAAALSYIQSCPDPGRNQLSAYLFGYLCHYALDCAAHPYVFYVTGFVRKGDPPTKKYNYYHRMFETAVDVLMVERDLGLNIYDLKATELIHLSRSEEAKIARMYHQLLPTVYGIDISTNQVITAIHDMKRIFAVLRDKYGSKKKLLSQVENRIAAPGAFTSTIYPRKVRDDLDYLNHKHSSWHLPWDDSKESTASFMDLFDKAIIDTLSLWQAACSYLREEISLEDATAQIGNRSFSTGLDCNLDLEFKYFDCIYERLL